MRLACVLGAAFSCGGPWRDVHVDIREAPQPPPVRAVVFEGEVLAEAAIVRTPCSGALVILDDRAEARTSSQGAFVLRASVADGTWALELEHPPGTRIGAGEAHVRGGRVEALTILVDPSRCPR